MSLEVRQTHVSLAESTALVADGRGGQCAHLLLDTGLCVELGASATSITRFVMDRAGTVDSRARALHD